MSLFQDKFHEDWIVSVQRGKRREQQDENKNEFVIHVFFHGSANPDAFARATFGRGLWAVQILRPSLTGFVGSGRPRGRPRKQSQEQKDPRPLFFSIVISPRVAVDQVFPSKTADRLLARLLS